MKKYIVAAIVLIFSSWVHADDARVVSTEPVYTTTTQYREVCSTVTTPSSGVGGAIAGAVIGGVVGNRFGGGSGRDAFTIAGAVAGSHVGRNMTEGNMITKNQCVNEPVTVQNVLQYKVIVDINGSYYTVYRSFSPQVGSMIPITLSVR